MQRLKAALAPLVQRSVQYKPARSLSSSAQSTTQSKQYYVTTPIYYVNADPHIGHFHSTLLADVFARWNNLRYPDQPRAVLCTGTDEHGMKIQRVAEAQHESPQALCDRVSERFKLLAQAANIDYQIFMRTTSAEHEIAVQHVWRELRERGFIYKSSYEGWYAVSDEAYYPPNQVTEKIDEQTNENYSVSIETGSRVEWMQEETYKFKLSAFKQNLLDWLKQEPSPLQPPQRAVSLINSLQENSLEDLSISRPRARLAWGIPVPEDPQHTIYVWLDALVNYMTAAGYPWSRETPSAVWPPNLMVIGKDILRFHAIYLPAVLMALNLPLPVNLLAHGHWTMEKFKMSKSRGNVANPFQAIELFGVDTMRAYLMKIGGNSETDSDYSPQEIQTFHRKLLGGQLGNLLSRIANKKLINKLSKPENLFIQPNEFEADVDGQLRHGLEQLPDLFSSCMHAFQPHSALNHLFHVLFLANKHFQTLEPWSETASAETVHRAMYWNSEALRICAILLHSVMPTKSSELLERLGVENSRRNWNFVQVGTGGRREMKLGGKALFPAVNAS